MSNKTKISITFWAHFLVASASHVFVLLMIGGCIKLVLATAALDFWVKGLLLKHQGEYQILLLRDR